MIQSMLLMGAGKATNTPSGGGAAPTIGRTANAGESGSGCGNTMTCDFVTAPANGVGLLCCIRDNTGTGISPPSGGAAWTEINSGSSSCKLYAKIAASEPTHYDRTYFGVAKADAAEFTIIEVTGIFTTFLDTNSTAQDSTDTSPSITTQQNFELAISVLGCSASSSGTPSGWTLVRFDSAGGLGNIVGIGFAYKVMNTAGATGTAVWSSGTPAKVWTLGARSI